MKTKYLTASIAFFIAIPLACLAQQGGEGKSVVVAPPVHPITEATLRQYFDACHFASRNREMLEMQFEKQRQELPAWYPADVWAETVQAVEDIDVVPIALPVYQKYYSEEVGHLAIRLFVTPDGQTMIKRVYDNVAHNEAAGDSSDEARRKALAAERALEDFRVHKMLDSLTPKEEQQAEAFVQSAEWHRLNALSGQIAHEFSVAYIAKQNQVAHEVAEKHNPEITKAIDDYKAAHPGASPGSNVAPQ